ncbi:YlzJ-like family protein [Longirhabdus pacifica]|uniref:YlzJ-like family protein n=1 Tax=Longirhabdus pacifica TaxID=2305227 RepID=UPI001008DB03|nr:YlzJ-like family protein [Longirhabdus pacifica]
MIMYSTIPQEIIYENIDKVNRTQEMVVDGITMEVQPMDGMQAKIVRLISADPQLFLNEKYAPGQVITMQPFIST